MTIAPGVQRRGAELPEVAPDAAWPTVSVIVPTRNRPDLLRRALRSIVGQRYPGGVECLVVFDQETPSDPRVAGRPERELRVLENGRSAGLAGARNTGVLAAQGELIAFCDDDDEWHPDKLRLQVQAMRAAPGTSIVCTGIEVVYGERILPRLPPPSVRFEDLLRSRIMELHPSTFLARRDGVVDGWGLVDEAIPGSYAEDYDWLLRAARLGPVTSVPRPLVRVHWHPSSWFAGRWDMVTQALGYLLERHPEFAGDARGLARIHGQLAFAHAAAGRRAEGARWALRAARHEPKRALLSIAVAAGVPASVVVKMVNRMGKGI